ncbi:MAG: hypothetical protein ABH875_02750, partial [Candidatus Omnitrophota bacterium]
FTLIELIISIAITVIIVGAIYFSLDTAMQSWEYIKDQLAIQKVLNETVDKIMSGSVVVFGIKDALEILNAGENRAEFVPPWTDNTHTVSDYNYKYTLNGNIKPGTPPPIGEVRLSDEEPYRIVSVSIVEEEASARSLVRLGEAIPGGYQLRFTYHVDPVSISEAVKSIWWDPEELEVFSEYKGKVSSMSENTFGVDITRMELRYYDKANNLITESQWVDGRDIGIIAGVELVLEARLGQYKAEAISFVALRNASTRSGYFPIHEGMKLNIPDSYDIHTLILKNITGVNNGDTIELKAIPDSDKTWRIRIVFSRSALIRPKIEQYVIEYPPGNEVLVEYPRTDMGAGLNLLALGTNGRYDYDYDGEDFDDKVLFKGDVTLEIERMDIKGAGIFVRP